MLICILLINFFSPIGLEKKRKLYVAERKHQRRKINQARLEVENLPVQRGNPKEAKREEETRLEKQSEQPALHQIGTNYLLCLLNTAHVWHQIRHLLILHRSNLPNCCLHMILSFFPVVYICAYFLLRSDASSFSSSSKSSSSSDSSSSYSSDSSSSSGSSDSGSSSDSSASSSDNHGKALSNFNRFASLRYALFTICRPFEAACC